MDNTYSITLVVLVVVIVGIVLGLIYSARRKRSGQFQEKFGTEYDHTVKAMGTEKKAQTALEERKKHVESLNHSFTYPN